VVGIGLLAVSAVAWVALVWFFRRAKAWLPYFVLGATGSTFLMVVAARSFLPVEEWLRIATADSVVAVGRLIGLNTSVSNVRAGELLVISVPHHNQWTLLTIGIECSGLLEAATLIGLVAFLPVRSVSGRVAACAVALAATFAANVVRLLVIVASLVYGGQGTLNVAHVVLGRAVFFVLTIAIFWFVVTRPTLAAVGARLREAH
jgi:exosortase family protein XrtG